MIYEYGRKSYITQPHWFTSLIRVYNCDSHCSWHLIWSRPPVCFFATSILNSVLRPLRRSVHPILYLRKSKMSTESSIIIPDGFTLHTENNSHILRSSNEAFLNPVQEFNRDTSVACIRVWSEEVNKTKVAKWRWAQEKKVKKSKDGAIKKRKGPWFYI